LDRTLKIARKKENIITLNTRTDNKSLLPALPPLRHAGVSELRLALPQRDGKLFDFIAPTEYPATEHDA
jgi:hypothetical protein